MFIFCSQLGLSAGLGPPGCGLKWVKLTCRTTEQTGQMSDESQKKPEIDTGAARWQRRVERALNRLADVVGATLMGRDVSEARLAALEILAMRTANRADAIETRLGTDRLMEGERLRVRVAKLEAWNCALSKDLASVSNRVESTDMVVVSDRDKFTGLSDRIDAVLRRVSKCEHGQSARLDRTHQEFDRIRDLNDGHHAWIKKVQQRVETTEGQLRGVGERIESLETSNTFKTGAITGMGYRNDTFEERIQSLEKPRNIELGPRYGDPDAPGMTLDELREREDKAPKLQGDPNALASALGGILAVQPETDPNEASTDDSNGDKDKE